MIEYVTYIIFGLCFIICCILGCAKALVKSNKISSNEVENQDLESSTEVIVSLEYISQFRTFSKSSINEDLEDSSREIRPDSFR